MVRLLLVPIISGVSYEFLKWAGRSNSLIVRAFSKPGLLLQGFTTREPDVSMIEVAIASVEAVFDWKAFIQDDNVEDIQLVDDVEDIESTENIDKVSANLNTLEEDNTIVSNKSSNKLDEDKVLQAVEQIVRDS